MEIIVPSAGLSSRFPSMRPKYLLYDYTGKLMIYQALKPYLNKYKITIGILEEHDKLYDAVESLRHEFGDLVDIFLFSETTTGPADTVCQMLERITATRGDTSVLIKDCDSFFDHTPINGNYVCTSNISEHDTLRRVSAKSFIIYNNQDIITDIMEKSVSSDTFCCGGYKFESAQQFINIYKTLTVSGEPFVSDVISKMISNGSVFIKNSVSNYVDVGTAEEWFEYNDVPVIFCDIDGTIIKNQGRIGKNNYNTSPILLQNNIDKLLEYQAKGCQIIFTTSRPTYTKQLTEKMLEDIGFKDFKLIIGLLNSRRILINDFNAANPWPRAVALNIERDSNTLGYYL